MRIEQPRVEVLRIPFREPVVSGTRRWHEHYAGILVLRTDDGRIGLGEFPAARPRDLGEDVSPRLVKTLEGLDLGDPASVERCLRGIDRWPFVGRAVRSAVESALVDMLARANHRSVAAHLAPTPSATVAVNGVLGIGPPDEVAAHAAELTRRGFVCLKLKAGNEPGGALAARLGTVREAVGAETALRVDFNGSLPASGAADVLASVAGFDLEYAEQPLAASAGAEALAHLRWTGVVPIAADESVRDVGSARVLVDTGAVDALVVKPARVGGLRQASAIVELATAAALPVTVSTMYETGVGLAGALHLAATTPGAQAHGLATADVLESDLLARSLAVHEGRMAVPTDPGLGIELDEAALARYRVA